MTSFDERFNVIVLWSEEKVKTSGIRIVASAAGLRSTVLPETDNIAKASLKVREIDGWSVMSDTEAVETVGAVASVVNLN